MLCSIASWTDRAIRPAHFRDSLDAYLLIAEISNCLLQCLWCVHVRIIDCFPWLVKYIIALIRTVARLLRRAGYKKRTHTPVLNLGTWESSGTARPPFIWGCKSQ